MASESLGRIRLAKRRDPFLAAWSRFRLRRVALSLGVAAFFAIGAPMAGVYVAPVGLEVSYILMALLVSIPFAVVLLAVIPPFECPACERPFSRKTSRELMALRNCAHCGIAVGTPEHSHY